MRHSFSKVVRAKLEGRDVRIWITDYLGHNFLTIPAFSYNLIPTVINACLDCGYKFLTHGQWKAVFKPGDEFTRRNYELKLIETLTTNLFSLAVTLARRGNSC